MNLITAIRYRCLLVVVVLVVASAVATFRGPLSLTRLAILFLLVLVLIVLASLDCAPLRGDTTLSNSLSVASILVVTFPWPLSPGPIPTALPSKVEYPAIRYPSTEGLSF